MDFVEYPDLISKDGNKLSIMAVDENELGPRFMTYDRKTGQIAWLDLDEVRVDTSGHTDNTSNNDTSGNMGFTALKDFLKDAEATEALIRIIKAFPATRL